MGFKGKKGKLFHIKIKEVQRGTSHKEVSLMAF